MALTERDPKAVFQKITTLQGLLREECVWADALNDASSGGLYSHPHILHYFDAEWHGVR